MCKRPVLESLVLVGVMGLAIGFYTLSCFAQGGETITITTYYPSPYGNYKELEMHEGAIFVPHNSAGDYVEDLECNADKEGKLVYGKKDSSVTEDTWYYCDGNEWKEVKGKGVFPSAMGGGSTFSCPDGYELSFIPYPNDKYFVGHIGEIGGIIAGEGCPYEGMSEEAAGNPAPCDCATDPCIQECEIGAFFSANISDRGYCYDTYYDGYQIRRIVYQATPVCVKK